MTDRHEHLDEGTIHAWLDGALSPDESARVEAASNHCIECATLVAEARGLIAASSRILSSLDTVPAGVIPGSSGNVDQLAALRARHSSRKRNWWGDRRIVAAASIVFVAGLSTMVWRTAPESARNLVAEQDAAAVQPIADSAGPAATAPTAGNDAASVAREAPARSDKAETMAPASPPAPTPVATRAVDTTAERKVAGTTSLTRNAVANEAKLADSSLGRTRQAEARREQARADQVAPVQQSLRQQGTVGQQQGFSQQLRPDTLRVNAPPPSIGAGARVAPMVARAAASADAVTGSCYRLRALVENERVVPDTVQLLNEIVPIERDPALYRARTFGSVRDTTFAWRMVDSITVQLRNGHGSGGVIIYFATNGAYQDFAMRSADTRIAASERITCPR